MEFGKVLECFAISLFLVVTAASGAAGQEEEAQMESEDFSLFYVEREQTSSFVGFVAENEPPFIGEVALFPSAPGLNEDTVVEAAIGNDARRTLNKPLEARLFYSTDDGETWTGLEMESVEGSESLWRAVIPGMGEPARVRYFFTALDDVGNALIELPVIAESGEESAKREGFAGAVQDARDSEAVVRDDLDIIGACVWRDGTRLHFGLKVAGRISGGTIAPFDAHIYSVGVYYPQSLPNVNERTNLLLVYAENAPFIHLPKVVLLDSLRDFNRLPAAEPEFSVDGEWLFLSFREDALEEGRFDRLRVVLGTSYSTGFKPMSLGMGLSSLFNIVPTDTTPFMNIVRADRSFEVGEEKVF